MICFVFVGCWSFDNIGAFPEIVTGVESCEHMTHVEIIMVGTRGSATEVIVCAIVAKNIEIQSTLLE